MTNGKRGDADRFLKRLKAASGTDEAGLYGLARITWRMTSPTLRLLSVAVSTMGDSVVG